MAFYFRRRVGELPHHVGTDQPDKARIVHGEAGFLSFGPYLDLDAGEYFAGFEVQKLTPLNDVDHLLIDTACDHGTRILARKQVCDRDLRGEVISLLTLRFTLSDRTSNVEVRLECIGSPHLRVRDLVIFQDVLS